MAALGQSITKLGQQLNKIKTTEDTATGLTEYSRAINEYNESLKDKRPEDYLANGELPQDLKERINGILEGKTGQAQRNLRNKFVILNEASRAEIGILAAKNKATQVKRDLPATLEVFATMKDREVGERSAKEYLNGLRPLLGKEATDTLLESFYRIRERNDIFIAIDIAEDSPTPENIAAAEKLIETSKRFPLQEDKDKFERALKSSISQQRQHRGLARKAINDENAIQILDAINTRTINAVNPTEDNENTFSIIQDRIAADDMGNEKNEPLYDQTRRSLQGGQVFTPSRILGLAEVFSSEHLNEARKLNDENTKMLKRIPEVKRAFDLIDQKYRETVNLVMVEESFGRQGSELIQALDEDKEVYIKEMREAMAEEIEASDIYNHINEKFEGTRKGVLESGWFRWYKSDIHDFVDDLEVRPEGTAFSEFEQERINAIINLLNDNTKKGNERIREALEAGWFR